MVNEKKLRGAEQPYLPREGCFWCAVLWQETLRFELFRLRVDFGVVVQGNG